MLERIGHSWFAPAVTLAAALENERRSRARERVQKRNEKEKERDSRFATNGNDLRERKSTSRERGRFMASIEQRRFEGVIKGEFYTRQW